MTKERKLLARAGLVIAQYRCKDPDDRNLHKLSHQIQKYFEDNLQDKPAPHPFIRLTDEEIANDDKKRQT